MNGPQERLTVSDAAKLLNVTPEAIRQRIRRGTIRYEQTEEGRYYVYVSPSEDVENNVGNAGQLSLDYIETLKHELEARNRELAEMRRLLAGALERIPAIEAPPDTTPQESLRDERESPVTASEERRNGDVSPEQERLSWWRRLFGLS